MTGPKPEFSAETVVTTTQRLVLGDPDDLQDVYTLKSVEKTPFNPDPELVDALISQEEQYIVQPRHNTLRETLLSAEIAVGFGGVGFLIAHFETNVSEQSGPVRTGLILGGIAFTLMECVSVISPALSRRQNNNIHVRRIQHLRDTFPNAIDTTTSETVEQR